MKVIASLLLLAVSAIAELVTVSPFPGKNVLTSRYARRGGFAHAVVNNKIYVFGGRYDLPYIVDPSDHDNPFGSRQNRFNVSSEVYTFNMDTDQWEQEATTTPYPLKRATTQVVGDTVYLMDAEFDSNATRSIDVWKYATAEKTWDKATRMEFIWFGGLKKCEKNGKIYITGSEDGRQLSIIHIYDTISNTWLDPIVVNEQLRIHEIWCLDNDLLQILAEPIRRSNGETVIFSGEGISQSRRMSTYTIHTNGSAIQDELAIDYHILERTVVKDGVLYILGRDARQLIISGIDLTTHEKHELVRIDSGTSFPMFVPYGDAIYLFGGRPSPRQRSENEIRTFSHKYVFGNKFNVQK